MRGALATLALAALLLPLAGGAAGEGDTSPPEFGAPLPEEGAWIATNPAFLAVQVFDNGSGVDPSRVEYSTEYDGAPFVRWYPAEVVPGDAAGAWVAIAHVEFPEGALSNIVWRAWDLAGNGPSESRITPLQVDTSRITFLDPSPSAEEWVVDPDTSARVWTAPAVDRREAELEFRTTTTGLFGFGGWRPWCRPSPPSEPGKPGTLCMWQVERNESGGISDGMGGYYAYNWSFAEGDGNWVQWRVTFSGSQRHYVSEPFQVRFDSLPPQVTSLSPGPELLRPLGPLELRFSAHEGSAEQVAQTGLDLSSARFRVRGPDDADFGPWSSMALDGRPEGEWGADFAASVSLPRGTSTVEVSVADRGGLAGTAQTTVRVNRAPVVAIEGAPNSLVVPVDDTRVLRALADDDGPAPLSFAWSLCEPNAPPLAQGPEVRLSGDGPPALSTAHLGDLTLCVHVADGLDGSSTLPVQVQLVPLGGPPGGTDGAAASDPFARPQLAPAGWDLTLLLLLSACLIAGRASLARWVRRRAVP